MINIAVINKYASLNTAQHMFYAKSTLGLDLFAAIRRFREQSLKRGWLVFSPQTFVSAAESDLLVFLDYPSGDTEQFSDLLLTGHRKMLVETELPHWIGQRVDYSRFDCVLSYRPAPNGAQSPWFDYRGYSVDMGKAGSENYGQVSDRSPGFTIIATNHYQNFEGELYSLRRSLAHCLSTDFPTLFSLAGRGWETEGLTSLGAISDKSSFIKERQFNICVKIVIRSPASLPKNIRGDILWCSTNLLFKGTI